MAHDKVVPKHGILIDGPVLTRRAFLGSTIAVSALPTLAQGDGSEMEFRLVFNWNANRTVLTIAQEERQAGYTDANDVARAPSAWKLLDEDAVWRLPKYVFGPNADFRLKDLSGQRQNGTDYTDLKAYELTVRRPQFGRLTRRDIKFILTAQPAPSNTSVFQPHASTPFSIAMSTNIWSLTAGPEKSSYFTLGKWVPSLQNEVEGETTPILLTAFLSGRDDESVGRSHLTQWVANGRAASSFKAMFNGLLDTRANNTQYGLFIRFTPAGIWHVDTRQSRPNEPVELTAIDGQVSIERVRFGWVNELSEADRIFSGTDAGTRDELVENSGVLAALCDFADQENEVTQLATPQEFNLRTDPKRIESRALWIRAGYAPAPRKGKVTSDQLEAELSWHDAWQLDLREPNNTLCNMNVWLEGVLRERVALPARQQDLSANTEGLVETRFDANFSDGQGVFSIQSPIGKMNATGAQKLELNKSEETIQQLDPWTAARIFENRSGSPVRLASVQEVSVTDPKNSKTSRAAAELLWFESNLEIQECFQQLAGSDYSRLTFAPTACVLLFAPGEKAPFGHTSFIDLSANEEGSVVALLDLDRARLQAGRGADLVHLTFQFRQLALEYLQHEATDDSKIPPRIVPISQTCRVTRVDAGADANQIANDNQQNVTQNGSSVPFRPRSYATGHTNDVDTRATLVVEFPPLHMFEETLFRPNPPGPPKITISEKDDPKIRINGQEVAIDDELGIAVALNSLETVSERIDARKDVIEEYRKYSIMDDGSQNENDLRREKFRAFKEFGDSLQTALRRLNSLPDDQRVYIGPLGLDPDAHGILRRHWADQQDAAISKFIDVGILGTAKESVQPILAAAAERVASGNQQLNDEALRHHPKDFDAALALEMALESAQPSYQLFRTYYREVMLDLFLAEEGSGVTELEKPVADALRAVGQNLNNLRPKTLDVRELEYVGALDGNRLWAGVDGQRIRKLRDEVVKAAYKSYLKGSDAVPQLVEGRLSKPSRLAFQINCRDEVQARRLATPELDRGDEQSSQNGRGSLEFSLSDLTRWSAFEMAVTRRARQLVSPDNSGRLDFLSNRLTNESENDFLTELGFPQGRSIMASDWLAHLQTTLSEPPGPFETSIEIPARLVLSPHQNAVFLTPQDLPEALQPKDKETRPRPLWSARLAFDGGNPDIRAVYSPDLRPSVFNAWAHKGVNLEGAAGNSFNLHGANPPPRGPLAPWYIDRHDSNKAPPSVRDYAHSYQGDESGEVPGDLTTDEQICNALETRALENVSGETRRYALPNIVDQLCRRFARRRDAGSNLRFRAPLDAAIRHELVLLSSGFGMPVVGRHDPRGAIIGNSQFLPGKQQQIADLRPGYAFYRPEPLGVTELELTALGGSIRAQTSFEPPAGALLLNDKPAFDAMSIERYQQWTVLGRDIFVEVVFKGFLLPFGHRASLVQVTERRFEMDPAGNVAAYLVQRMYIQRGTKTQRFPGLGQPYAGRQFPAHSVTIVTERTADIVDPFGDADEVAGPARQAGPTGRVNLENNVGLVFWPRTLRSEDANVRFDLQIDEHFATLPLLFVDNTAANNPETLAEIALYYNGLSNPDDKVEIPTIEQKKHISTLVFGGEKLRYADEEKSGSCSVETESWTLSLSGRVSDVEDIRPETDPLNLGKITLRTADFVFGPVLQGADRIPLYPTLRTARVFLRQNDQLTGTAQPKPIRVQYDGRYILSGLPRKQAAGQTPVVSNDSNKNRSEIFLSFIDPVEQSIGNNGDNTGGMYRPDTTLVAFSRLNGPMGVGKPSKVASVTPVDGVLVDTAALFHLDELPVAAEPQQVNQQTATSNARPAEAQRSVAQSTPNVAQTRADATQLISDAKNLYKRYFSSDAKLLGLITFQELIQLVIEIQGGKNADPQSNMPKLQELVRYGAGNAAKQIEDEIDEAVDAVAGEVLDAAESGLDSITDFVRAKIALPLSEALEAILEDWNTINASVEKSQDAFKGISEPIGLNEVLPGMYAALVDLKASLDAALAENDDIVFTLSLGEVYEAGRRLIDTVSRILSEIDEIIEEAIGSRINNVIKLVKTVTDGFEATVELVAESLLTALLKDVGVPDVSPDFLASALAKVLVQGGDAEQLAPQASKALMEFIMPEIEGDTSGGRDVAYRYAPLPPLSIPGITEDQKNALAKTLRLSTFEVKSIITIVLEKLMDGTGNLESVVSGQHFPDPEDLSQSTTDAEREALERLSLPKRLLALQNARLDAAIKTIETQTEFGLELSRRLTQFKRFMDDPEAVAGKELEALAYRLFADEIALFERARDRVRAVRMAIANEQVVLAVKETVSFIEIFSGPLPSVNFRVITARAAELLNKVGEAINAAALSTAVTPALSNPTGCEVNSEQNTIDRKYRPKDERSLGGRVWQAYEVVAGASDDIAMAQTQLSDFLEDEKVIDILNSEENVGERVIPRLESAMDSVADALTNIQKQTATTYCDLYNDAMTATQMEADWSALVKNISDLGSDLNDSALAEVVDAFEEFPDRYEQLLRSRQRGLDTLTTRVDEMIGEVGRLVNNRDVLILIGVGGTVGGVIGGIEEETKVKAQQLVDAAKEKAEKAQAAAKALEARVENLLYRITQKIRALVSLLERFTKEIQTFATNTIDEINALGLPVSLTFADGTDVFTTIKSDISDYVAYLTEVGAALEAISKLAEANVEGTGNEPRVPLDGLKTVAAEIKGKEVPILEFTKVSAEVNPGTIQDLRRLQAEIEAIPQTLKSALRDLLGAARTEVLKKLDGPARQLLSQQSSGKPWLSALYGKVLEQRNDAYLALSSNVASQQLGASFLVEVSEDRYHPTIFKKPDDSTLLDQTNDRLAADVIWLAHLTSSGSKPLSDPDQRTFIVNFFKEWGDQGATPFLIAEQVGGLIKDVLRGDVLKLVPIQQIRDEIEDHILEMVPSNITRSYQYGTELPSEIEKLTLGIFKPGEDCKLSVGMKFEIDLFPDDSKKSLEAIDPSIEFESIGSLGAFDIKLIGDLLDALTLHFGGASFETRSGQKPRFDVAYEDFTIGPALEFVAQLAAYLSPGGSGPYVTPTKGFPGIEAGYGLNVGTFSIGTLSFFNISLNASALLPFNDLPTRFRASLSRREAPFTLSYAPWGGSGFFAIDADADGIVGFEASFEFGGAAAFAIGPLTGQGRLMAGFYIRQTRVGSRSLTEMAATFFVGGSANIWIFSFSSSLYVRLGMTNGNMTGLAVFTFSFSIGIKDFDFSVEWRKEEKKGFQGETVASLDLLRRIRFAGGSDVAGPTSAIEANTTCQSRDWQTYSTYFDTTLDQSEAWADDFKG